tara:strand:+ start:145 stop:591 length:447 start_codon:yes stop_codon:yes gene_type:complete
MKKREIDQSSETVTVGEFLSCENTLAVDCASEYTNEPLIVLLEYTFTCNAMLTADSIQTRFGGGGLPTTIIDHHVVITHSSNVVAMKKHIGGVIFLVVDHFSVGRLPVDVAADSGIHLLFNLTHDLVWLFELKVVWTISGAIARGSGH